ncbi:GNAT family N-acetyltransferase [Novosphingobium ovatum]|nr:GNAT family N-acetyltransferase [Novosphingobium ovatum]
MADPGDAAALKALVESGYRGDSARRGWTHEADLLSDERITLAELQALLADSTVRVLVRDGAAGALAGCVCVTDRGAGVAYLGMLCVDPALQAGGIGRALIAAAHEAARDHFAAQTMEMTVISARPELIAYYQRRGYARTGETRPFPGVGGDHLSMVVLACALG